MDRSADGLSAAQIARDLRALGVAPGGTLMVHSSLSALGRVAGGAPTVIRALLAALGPEGTLVLPAFRDGPHLPGMHATVPAALERAAQAAPEFDPAATPTNLGAIPEAFRQWPGVIRSRHPLVSVCCLGPRAAEIAEPHPPAWGTGPGSPFDRLHRMDAQILLLGVGFNRLSLLHHAETLVPGGRRKTRVLATPRGIELVPDAGNDLDTHFPLIGAEILAAGAARRGQVGAARSILMHARPAVSFARAYLERVFPAPAAAP
jgi:aminoglycoside 3-N-acetyltransferase